MPYFALTVIDRRMPFNSLLQPSRLAGTAVAGGYHLAYLPKEIATNSVFARMDSGMLQQVLLGFLRQLFPDLQMGDVAAVRFTRDHCAEPLPLAGEFALGPALLGAAPGLYFANTTQLYPRHADADAMVGYAAQAAEQIAPLHYAGDQERAVSA
jgi:hypothetical protein